jgi:transcriptional regulator GlxA family with amidase domain
VAVILFDEVELLDVAGVAAVLGAAGRQWNYRPFKIVPVGKVTGRVDTRSQIRIEAASTLGDCPKPELVVVPGGYGARRAVTDTEMVDYLRNVAPSVTQFVCVGNGALLLASAGLTADLDVAVPAEIAASLTELSPTTRPDTVARFRESGKVLSAGAAAGAMDAALHLVSKLLGKKQAETVALSLGLTWNEGHPSAVSILEPNG